MNWIKLWKIPEGHWLNSDSRYFAAWIKLIQRAETKDKNLVIRGTMVEAKRGSVYASENELAKDWGVSRRLVHSFLEKCERDGMVSVQRKSNRYLVIKVSNYAKFQDRPSDERTTEPHQKHNRSTTEAQQNGVSSYRSIKNIQNIQKGRNAFANFPQRETNYDELFEEAERCS